MPTLTRLFVWLLVLIALAYAAMVGISHFVEPNRVERSITVPLGNEKGAFD